MKLQKRIMCVRPPRYMGVAKVKERMSILFRRRLSFIFWEIFWEM